MRLKAFERKGVRGHVEKAFERAETQLPGSYVEEEEPK